MCAVQVRAEAGLLWGATDRHPLIVPRTETLQTVTTNVPTLFAGRATYGLFAPVSARSVPDVYTPRSVPHRSDPASRILDIVAKAEAGAAGYDAVIWAARIKTPKPPTEMTLREIYDWIVATPGQHHAIGRYQFIPDTLRRLVVISGADLDQRFTPAFQDRLARILLDEAGLQEFHSREIGRITFMNNLAKIWAGLPNASGRSHYHGYAGNRATITWAAYSAHMAEIYGDL